MNINEILEINDTTITIKAKYKNASSNMSKSLELLKQNKRYNENVRDCVEFIRTIFLNFEEEELEITFDNDSVLEYVKYNNKSLVEYKYEVKNANETIRYSNSKISVTNGTKHFGNYEVRNFIEKINQLKNVEYSKVNNLDEIIVYTYQLFYNEIPDFKDLDVKDKTQIMLYILSKITYYFSNKFNSYFTRYTDLPYNELIDYEMNKLQLYNIPVYKVEPSENFKKVQVLGNSIRDCNESLEIISEAFHNYYNDFECDSSILEGINNQFRLEIKKQQ